MEVESIERMLDLEDQLRVWAIDNKITHQAIGELLTVLKSNGHENLPKDSRTLLHTPRSIHIEKMGSGSFWYGGINQCLANILRPNIYENNEISLNFNMDGLPLSRSSKIEFWPILMNIANDLTISPMVVGIYCGVGKPSAEEYLEKFVDGLLAILTDGLTVNGVFFKVSINAFICDTPARCFLKCK